MGITQFLKYAGIGFGLQVFLHIIAILAPLNWRPRLLAIYAPAIELGDYLFAPSGSGGHAVAGGAILGWLVAIVVYSMVIGVIIILWKKRTSSQTS